MKYTKHHRRVFAALLLTMTATTMAETPTTSPATAAATQPASDYLKTASYGIGYDMGRQISGAPFKIDIDQLVAGLRDSTGGKPSSIPDADVRAALAQLQKEAAAGAEAADKAKGEANGKAGEAYRADNGKKPGVVTTASGLEIETLKEGNGETPKPTDTVKVHYTGTLIDGTKFDSSVDRGEPVTFPLNGVIKGWTEGLQLMKVGGKSRLVIPPEIGYGPSGHGPIPPNATLVFEVELLGIEK